VLRTLRLDELPQLLNGLPRGIPTRHPDGSPTLPRPAARVQPQREQRGAAPALAPRRVRPPYARRARAQRLTTGRGFMPYGISSSGSDATQT